jgi:hypothetical protein
VAPRHTSKFLKVCFQVSRFVAVKSARH